MATNNYSAHTQGTPPEAEVVRDLAQLVAEPRPVGDPESPKALIYVLPGVEEPVVVDLEEYEDNPRRVSGTTTLLGPDSFADYVNKHKVDDATALYADEEARRIVAVLNGDTGTTPGWNTHTAVFTAEFTPEWSRWVGASGRPMTQETFAEFLEEGELELKEPDAATMLEIAQSFQATSKATIESAVRLDNGQISVAYQETIGAKAGQKGNLEIPREFTIALFPFKGLDPSTTQPYEVKALLRYRLNNGTLSMSYKLVRPEDVVRDAWRQDVVKPIADTTLLPVLAGRPHN